MTTRTDSTPTGLEDLVGAFRRLGPTGPTYQILDAGAKAHASMPTMKIRIIESGEELDYRVDRILKDPED